MYQNNVAHIARNAIHTKCIKFPSTRSQRNVKLLKADVVTTENNKVSEDKQNPSSERR